MGDDENQSLADRMKSKDDDSGTSLADSKKATQESASLHEKLHMSGEESDPSEVTRPSREGFADKFQNALDRAKEQAAAAEQDDQPPSLADKLRETKEKPKGDDKGRSRDD